jgi:hypothetical protein
MRYGCNKSYYVTENVKPHLLPPQRQILLYAE